MRKIFEKFRKSVSGSLATTTGVLAVPVAMAGGVALDYTLMTNYHSSLQAAADTAALASAKEMALTSTSEDAIKGIAKSYVYSSLASGSGFSDAATNLAIDVNMSNGRKDVSVELAYTWKPLIVQYFNANALPLKASAKASLAGSEEICVIALDQSSQASLAMTGVSKVQANGCAVYSNSNHASGVGVVSGALLQSSNTYSGGGYRGSMGSYKPVPVTDSPIIADPLLGRQPPSVGNCDYKNMQSTLKTAKKTNKKAPVILKPGIYCGGIQMNGSMTIELQPGVYVMKDGPLSIGGNATINGKNVGFYFTGTNATFDFGVSTQASLTAPKTGPLSGILFFEDRSSPVGRDFVIRSKDAEKFEGTVYLPKGRFVVDKASRVGQNSNWTAIIARQIEIKKGPELQINSDYAGSDIPVPDGIGPNGAVRLTR